VEEGRWHESQKLTRQPDGGLLAEFRLSTSEEISKWLLSFGRHAHVEEPDELREWMAEELKAMGENYGRTRQETGKPGDS
jgi:predicted DNA-binding transcriptional regulator YafY